MNLNHSGIALFPLFYLLFLHFIADFIAQSDEMARNKSKSNAYLLYHVSVYTFIFLVALSPVGFKKAAIFAGINGVLHFITDYVTSRISSKFFAKQDFHNGFLTVGGDQLCHYVCLIISYKLIYT